MTLRIGELCAGYGGLTQVIASVLDATPAWHAQYDPDDDNQHAARILEHHFPRHPNHGDITAIDYARVEPVDILAAGYPCQPMSAAGKQKGENDPRWLWPHVARAIEALRPPLILLENVRNHLRIGFDTVLGDLHDLGYDASWTVLPASAAGAPHKRERLFILAAPRLERPEPDSAPLALHCDSAWWDGAESLFGPVGFAGDLPAGGRMRSGAIYAGPVAPEVPGGRLLKTPTGNLGSNGGSQHPDKRRAGGHGPTLADEIEHLLPRRSPTALLPTPRATDGAKGGPNQRGSSGDLMLPSAVFRLTEGMAAPCGCAAWGQYGEAIHRWEVVLGRSAPEPTVASPRGGRVLSSAAVEFMMGVPVGWVTGVPGIPRNAQLRALGNGVVPQQGVLALRSLLGDYSAAMAELAAAEGGAP